jgi:hypothetical protein
MSQLRCPYCNGLNLDLYEYGLDHEQHDVIECVHCERSLELHCYVKVSYEFRIPPGEPHPEDVAAEAEGKS